MSETTLPEQSPPPKVVSFFSTHTHAIEVYDRFAARKTGNARADRENAFLSLRNEIKGSSSLWVIKQAKLLALRVAEAYGWNPAIEAPPRPGPGYMPGSERRSRKQERGIGAPR